ncbi:SNF1-related protein kinase regulatory subunit gamma-like PV42a [Apostasia shenzhenica]|uniref:SNF1-related protein kinase regulatory subunit gamma-like PV42a n=1 Tax=Apostasia shenzhenica TaxID=1088818 RepID=A0A2I0AAS5_9ASPA|nr:SNF1-related protein kinase regulatory subunit gamma-like PV42a [Apostasia shenzhenica]
MRCNYVDITFESTIMWIKFLKDFGNLHTFLLNYSILDCMETFSKGVHRALVPLDPHIEGTIVVELVEASPGYRMLTQMDVLIFLRANGNEIKDVMSCSVAELGAVNENIFALTRNTKVIEAIRAMRTFALVAVPVIAVEEDQGCGDEQLLQDGRGRRLIDTFSATDLRGCSVAQLQSMLNVSVVEFKERVSAAASSTLLDASKQKLITCYHDTELSKVIDEAVMAHVHRVWVVDRQGLLMGLVSLTDILRVIREKAMTIMEELQEVAATEPTL